MVLRLPEERQSETGRLSLPRICRAFPFNVNVAVLNTVGKKMFSLGVKKI